MSRRGTFAYNVLTAAMAETPPSCRGDDRFVADGQRAEELVPICNACALMRLCREYASSERPEAGIWAGVKYPRSQGRRRKMGRSMAETVEVRPVDRARAARMIAAQLAGDGEMFAVAVGETLDDNYGFAGLGSTIAVLRSLSEDLAAAVLERHGERSLALVQKVIVDASAAEAE